jgi:hypothetical protein
MPHMEVRRINIKKNSAFFRFPFVNALALPDPFFPPVSSHAGLILSHNIYMNDEANQASKVRIVLRTADTNSNRALCNARKARRGNAQDPNHSRRVGKYRI